jgi:hypothetical protein
MKETPLEFIRKMRSKARLGDRFYRAVLRTPDFSDVDVYLTAQSMIAALAQANELMSMYMTTLVALEELNEEGNSIGGIYCDEARN